ncbi:MAG: CopG family transcriptional regulator [Kiritimatiellia bacterium]
MKEAGPAGEESAQNEVDREVLRRRWRVQEFERLRRQIIPLAEANGFFTDDDVMRATTEHLHED